MNEVNSVQVAAAARQLALAIGGYAVGRGWLEDDTVTAIATVAVLIVPFIWGQLTTRKLVKKNGE
jgi:hypothetical protein